MNGAFESLTPASDEVDFSTNLELVELGMTLGTWRVEGALIIAGIVLDLASSLFR